MVCGFRSHFKLLAHRRCDRAAFEIVALAAGWLGELALAGQSVIMTTDMSTCVAFNRYRWRLINYAVIATIPFGFGKFSCQLVEPLRITQTKVSWRRIASEISLARGPPSAHVQRPTQAHSSAYWSASQSWSFSWSPETYVHLAHWL